MSKQEEGKTAKTNMVEHKISWTAWFQRLYRKGEEVGEEVAAHVKCHEMVPMSCKGRGVFEGWGNARYYIFSMMSVKGYKDKLDR